MAREKSIFTREYLIFLATLRRLREEAGVTQSVVGKAMGRDQSVVSKCERGERRLDIVEVVYYCQGIGLEFEQFTKILMVDLGADQRSRRRRRAKR
jgi:transcriptional regulator with XRE-family HTH domain